MNGDVCNYIVDFETVFSRLSNSLVDKTELHLGLGLTVSTTTVPSDSLDKSRIKSRMSIDANSCATMEFLSLSMELSMEFAT
jgi:hypothetical protein